jgi:branched-chain amino acid transport system ATP-binding protein
MTETGAARKDAAIACHELDAGYSGTAVLRHCTLSVQPGRILSVIGPNGAGKSTLLMTLAGLLPPIGGRVELFGEPLPRKAPHEVNRRGLALVLEDRGLFNSLTVTENLKVACRRGRGAVEEMFARFPALEPKANTAAGMLSGGEQQMLTLARALIQRPKVLLVDEMSMGLAPIIVESLMNELKAIATELGVAVVLVEQHSGLALEVSDEAVVVVHGEVVHQSSAAALIESPEILQAAYLKRAGTAAPAES